MVYLFLANGFEEIEALTPLDLLRRAKVEVTTVGIGGTRIVGSHGIAVEADIPDTMFRDNAPDMVILPGGMPGSKNLAASNTVKVALSVTEKHGGYLCAICAAPFILGEQNYLIGKNATCYPGFENQLLGAFPSTKGVVQDGNIITGKGMGVATEFGLKLVEVMTDKKTATDLAKAIQYK